MTKRCVNMQSEIIVDVLAGKPEVAFVTYCHVSILEEGAGVGGGGGG